MIEFGLALSFIGLVGFLVSFPATGWASYFTSDDVGEDIMNETATSIALISSVLLVIGIAILTLSGN